MPWFGLKSLMPLRLEVGLLRVLICLSLTFKHYFEYLKASTYYVDKIFDRRCFFQSTVRSIKTRRCFSLISVRLGDFLGDLRRDAMLHMKK